MKTDYEYIIVESFNPSDTSGRHGPTHVRPIPGQGLFKPDMFVQCSRSLVTDYPVGTRFKIRAKITNREGGTPFISSHYTWRYEVLEKKT
ncbi:MAG: hypothetical protein DI539_30730 [Flavobacterium psychrophilum]|nr:MAG: hypothetical protein DI539_30730 [Flavobacterium psychrophilum]